MKIVAFVLSSAIFFSFTPVSAGTLFLEGGIGYAKSVNGEMLGARYQRPTSKLFGRDSCWEAVAAYWNNDNHDWAAGIARGIQWNKLPARAVSTTLGLVGVGRRTENIGTNWQFYFRFAYDFKIVNRDFSLGLVHFSNGKKLFGWEGPNNGENFATLSIGFF